MFTFLTTWIRMNVFHPAIFMELAALALSYLLAWNTARRLRQYFEKTIRENKSPDKFNLNPHWFSVIVRHIVLLLLIWFWEGVFQAWELPAEIFSLAFNLVLAVLIYRFVSWYVKSNFWSYCVLGLYGGGIALQAAGLWGHTINLLESMSMSTGHLSISILDVGRAILTFIVLWSTASMANRYFRFLLAASSRMNYSDRILLERVINFASMMVVSLFTMAAVGIHPAALAITGGAAGFAIGVGLQKMGSNLVSGIALLIQKPIHQGDVILLEKNFGSISRLGQIRAIGLLYVHITTRDGVEEFIPNESFMTQKIVNLSGGGNKFRLRIPFSVSYASDLYQVMEMTQKAANKVDRILRLPEPKCLITNFGHSSVELELRVWVNDPKKGVANVKSSLLLAVWDAFQANGIEIAFPQRDLHIKSAVPVKIVKDYSP
jgi:small-conductance mechanosensitive channel